MKKKQISIAFVNHTFFPETYGGAEHQTLRLNLDLHTKNIRTIILSPRLKKETPKQNYIENIFIKRFKVNNFPNLGGKYIFSFFIWSIKIIYWLVKNSNKFDIIHIIHGRLHSVPAIFAAKILKKPVIVKLGRGGEKYFDINVVNNKKIIGPFFAKFILRNVSGWIANSKLIEDDLKKYNIDEVNIHKIYNGINIKNIRINKFRKEKTFVVVGRLEEENLRISNELFETKTKFEIMKKEMEKFQEQRSNLINKLNSINEAVEDSNVVTSVFENNHNRNKINIQNINKKEKNLDLNKEVQNIFAKS